MKRWVIIILILLSIPSVKADELYLNEISTLTAGDSADAFGLIIEPAGDINNDGYNDVWIMQRFSERATAPAISGLYLYYGGDPMDSTPDLILKDTIYAVANVGDMNQDGFDDFIITFGTTSDRKVPTIKLYYGGPIFDTIPELVCVPLDSMHFWSTTGWPHALTGGYDFDGEGTADLVIGFPTTVPKISFAGFYAGEALLDSVIDIQFNGDTTGNYIDYSNNVALIRNLDGSDYLAISERARSLSDSLGRVFLYKTGPQFDTIPEFIVRPPLIYPSRTFGWLVRDLGDVNDDGYGDMAISNGYGAEGYIYFGGSTFDMDYDVLIQPGFTHLMKLGDINNDGYNDFGAADDFLNGNTVLYYGGPDVDGFFDVRLNFDRVKYNGFGRHAKELGDVNGDGLPDFAVSMTLDSMLWLSGVVKIYAGYDGIPTDVKYDYEPNLPDNFILNQNYPNPFNPTTMISFEVPTKSDITLSIHNILGQKIRTLINRNLSAGTYTLQWDGKNESGQPVSSGIYIYKLESDEISQSKKMMLLK